MTERKKDGRRESTKNDNLMKSEEIERNFRRKNTRKNFSLVWYMNIFEWPKLLMYNFIVIMNIQDNNTSKQNLQVIPIGWEKFHFCRTHFPGLH